MPRAVNTNVDFLFNDPFVLNLITRSLNSKAIMAKDARPWVDVTADRQNRALPWHDRYFNSMSYGVFLVADHIICIGLLVFLSP